jgi:hypothetical protein
MAIFSECTVTNPDNTASLESIDRSINDGFKLLARTMTDLVAPSKQPVQEIIPNGSLTIPYGTISLTNDGQNNIVWTDKQGNQQLDQGTTTEVFVVGASVYLMGSDGIPYVISADKLSGWDSLSIRAYNDLKSCALKIITANPVTAPQA